MIYHPDFSLRTQLIQMQAAWANWKAEQEQKLEQSKRSQSARNKLYRRGCFQSKLKPGVMALLASDPQKKFDAKAITAHLRLNGYPHAESSKVKARMKTLTEDFLVTCHLGKTLSWSHRRAIIASEVAKESNCKLRVAGKM